MWDLWWSKWQGYRFFLGVLRLLLSIVFHRGSAYSYITWKMKIGQLGAAVHRHSHTPSTWTTITMLSFDLTAGPPKQTCVCVCVCVDGKLAVAFCRQGNGNWYRKRQGHFFTIQGNISSSKTMLCGVTLFECFSVHLLQENSCMRSTISGPITQCSKSLHVERREFA
jgi:hypothetical protein